MRVVRNTRGSEVKPPRARDVMSAAGDGQLSKLTGAAHRGKRGQGTRSSYSAKISVLAGPLARSRPSVGSQFDCSQKPEAQRMNTHREDRPMKRLAYAFVGLVAGDAVLLLFLLQNATRLRADLLVLHMGEPGEQIPQTLQLFVMYACFSFVGWLLVGLPAALLFSARSIARLPWPLRPLVGAALGPLALFLVLMLLAHGHLDFPRTFLGTGWLWAFSMLVSTTAFLLYTGLLLRKQKPPY